MIPLILPGADLAIRQITEDTWPEAMHHVKVRRVRAGELLLLGDGAGKRVQVTIESIDKKQILLTAHKELPQQTKPAITLWMPLIEKNALEEAVHLVCQPGVAAIRLFKSEFTVAPALREKDIVRLQKIALNSCIQAEQAWLPEMHLEPVPFVELPWTEGAWFVAMERREEKEGRETPRTNQAHVLVGPEGGWSPRERESLLALHAAGKVHLLDLGHGILRAQTAALISCWHVAQQYGE